MSIDAVHGNHVVGIVLGFQIENQRRISDDAQRRRRKQSPLVAMRSVLTQHASRRPCAIRKVVRPRGKQALKSVRSLQATYLAEFGGGESPGVGVVLPPIFPVETLLVW